MTSPTATLSRQPSGSSPRRIVIIGASAAGLYTAEALRRHGFSGEITIAGDEPPYDRPPLSKQVLKGEWTHDRATLMPAARQNGIGARLLTATAVSLDIEGRRVVFQEGEPLEYDELVIATGVQPRKLPDANHPGVHVLRTIEQSLKLREDILQHGRLLIVGAGFIGLEAAATAAAMGAKVTIVEPLTNPLASRIGAHAAARLLEKHRSSGVDLRLGLGVRSFVVTPSGRIQSVTLTNGEFIETPAVLVGIGCAPGVQWLQGSGLNLKDGVVCDQYCAAAPHVWAAGDVARWHHAGLDRDIRLEHRTNAAEQGAAVARNILGAAQPFTPVPFFWTDQFDVKLQLAGLLPDLPEEEGAIEFGDEQSGSFVRTFRRDGRLVGALAWNAAKAMAGFRRELNFDVPARAITAPDEHLATRNPQ